MQFYQRSGRDDTIDSYYIKQLAALIGTEETSSLAANVDPVLSENSTNAVENRIIVAALSNKIDKVEGKDLSTEDFTTSYKNLLDNVDTTPSNSNKLITSKAVYDALSTKIDTDDQIEFDCVID